jgi:hypothetical protein
VNQVVPFNSGDFAGKRGEAIEDAMEQLTKQEHGSVREKLYALQKSIGDLPEIDCPLQHVFAPGAYARTIFIPQNGTLVGKIHKHAHLNILSMGMVSVLTESGGVEHLQGPVTMVSPPGTKRAVYAHTDVVWTTIHLTTETDLEKIEDEVIAKSFEDYEKFLIEKGKAMKQIEVSK